MNSQSTHPNNKFDCTPEFCDIHLELNPCPQVRNCSTAGYRDFLFPGPCNCCPYCYDYLEEGKSCRKTEYTMLTEICGPYLECAGPDENETCEPSK